MSAVILTVQPEVKKKEQRKACINQLQRKQHAKAHR